MSATIDNATFSTIVYELSVNIAAGGSWETELNTQNVVFGGVPSDGGFMWIFLPGNSTSLSLLPDDLSTYLPPDLSDFLLGPGFSMVGCYRNIIPGLRQCGLYGGAITAMSAESPDGTFGFSGVLGEVDQVDQKIARPEPEPATLALFGAGLAAVAAIRRRTFRFVKR